ncbi:peptidylprolyl isomerase [Bacillaceae bacterium JMAK1]|nr:peptidylprolyl isomerase [Bacillaceae bacterium JMAK1]
MRKKWMQVMGIAPLLVLAACGTAEEEGLDESSGDEDVAQDEVDQEEPEESSAETDTEVDRSDAIEAIMVMEDGGEVVLELYPNNAPETVENFVTLAEDGFYDGLTFHRIIPGFMVQGGDPEGSGQGGSPDTIAGEFAANDFDNPLDHTEGVISMARTPDPNSASSQFFIMVGDHPSLDGEYAAFGEVISGMDVVDDIAATEVSGETPVEGEVPIIETITIES